MQHQFGHCRRPSASSSVGGKAMPISALLINLNPTQNAHHHQQPWLDQRSDDGGGSIHEPSCSQQHCDHLCHDSDSDNDLEPNSNGSYRTEVLLDASATSKTRITIERDNEENNAPSSSDEDTRPIMNKQEYHERLAVAEALARTSMMTSPAARRRLAARKVEMDMLAGDDDFDDEHYDYVPPQQLLMYMVRMGSFNSAPKILNADTQDDSITIPPHGLSPVELVQHCRLMRGEDRPPLLRRSFLKDPTQSPWLAANDVTEGLRYLQLDAVSKACGSPSSPANKIRLLQWNILSQSLGQSNDNFVRCPDEALFWENRKYLIIQEIVQTNPDIVCLQEVDHFKFLQTVLGTQNYEGVFFPKPDSPCLYISENNGPDGCAIFYKRDKFELLDHHTRILEVWRVQSNQVAIAANFRIRETGREVSVCTTHLKARSGSLLSKLRNEQGKDLLRFANKIAGNRPQLLCGDFNAEPIEPVYSTILSHPSTVLSSAYADMIASKNMACSEASAAAAASSHNVPSSVSPPLTPTASESASETDASGSTTVSRIDVLAAQEPPFTTWKIREDGEVCHTIDYVFYTPDRLCVQNCLMFPKSSDIGTDRTPSFQYPSDHFSLVCDFELLDGDETEDKVANS